MEQKKKKCLFIFHLENMLKTTEFSIIYTKYFLDPFLPTHFTNSSPFLLTALKKVS